MSADFLRLDRWLWFARFYKTRTDSTAAVKGGHVDVNGERATPGHRTQVGDRVTLVKQQLHYRMVVTGIPQRRGPAAEARACYTEDPASIAARAERLVQLQQDRQLMPRTRGRPDKHTRRKLRDRNRSEDPQD